MTNNTTAALTDEQIVEIYDDFYTQEDERESSHILPFARAIERALLTSPRAAVQASANLEDLRKKLLTPREIIRDEQGWLTHPDMPCCDEDVRADELLAAFHIDTAFVSMESDGNEDACEAYFERGDADCSAWTPTPPTGEGWLLLEIYDTEDGPYALYGRDRYEVERAEKRAHSKRLRERLGIDAAPAAPVAVLSEDDAANLITIDRRDLYGFVRGSIKRALEDASHGAAESREPMSAVDCWSEAHTRTIEIFDSMKIAGIGEVQSAAQAVAADGAACKGKNCGATDGVSHSPECVAEHEATVTGAIAADGALGEPDTSYKAPYAGHAFKYHSRDQIIEYGNARARAAVSPATADERAAFIEAIVPILTVHGHKDIAERIANQVADGNQLPYQMFVAGRASQAAAPAEPFPYQKTFNAIAAATSIVGGHVSISVKAFQDAFGAAPAEAREPSDSYPGANLEIIEKAIYCNQHGDTESVENWLDHLRERLAAPANAVAWICSGSNDFAPIVRDRAAALKLSQEHGDGKIVALGIVPDVDSQGAQGGKGGEA
ncbi:hypothetical protein [Burkholderia gladioli]|uniref:hypothetical protein n=1 Tax=Burkholderia gladioli TaxID=28095 RepID=UPI00164023A0|nr:hypothetical protein [Burkholderia gladioli]